MNRTYSKLILAIALVSLGAYNSVMAARVYNWDSNASTIDGVEVTRNTTTQTLTNKTLTSPTLNSPIINTPTLNGFAKINQTATAMEIETDTNSSASPVLTIDNNDTTNNPSSIKIENGGSGKDIETEALSLTNGKITLIDATGFEIENAATGNAVALTVDQNDTTGNNVALSVENAGTGGSITITAAASYAPVSVNTIKQPYWISVPVAATTAAMNADDGTGVSVGAITLAANTIVLDTVLDVTTGYNEAGDTLEVHISTNQTIAGTISELIADVDCSAATTQVNALADGVTSARTTSTNKYINVFYKDVGNDAGAAANLVGVLYVQVLPQ